MLSLMRFNIFLVFLFIFLYLILNIILSIRKNNKVLLKYQINMGFFLSLLLIIALTMFPTSIDFKQEINYNIVPFKIITAHIQEGVTFSSIFNIAGNIILFIPLGFFGYIKYKQNIFNTLFLCLFTTLFAEFIQLFIPARLSDVDDLVLNFLGGVIGMLLSYLISYTIYPKRIKVED